MADLKQLNIVKELALKKERTALQALSAAQQQMAGLQQQLKTLQQYKTDYVAQISATGREGVTVANLLLLQNFLAKIDTSLTQQRDIIARAQLAVNSRRTQWQQARQYLDSISHLISSSEQKIIDVELKKEQKLADEFAMMAYYRKLKASR
ncbi:MAG: flagellar export protein FliJ [Gammaproteobacteria bacterium]|nr:flagellar export protein FliJ [Gammaproteobacteria bacterium]